VPKFELHKHNDELFNIIMGFFMNFELKVHKKSGNIC
jgi:hypothetical protein